jgi:predicted alpha/beta hydrolase family esterase
MRSSDVDILIVPGLGSSGADHWQTRWQAKLSTARRVAQDDWETPRRDAWVARILEAIDAAARPVVIVAHSLGCIAVAHAAADFAPGRVKGALLVAPPSARAIQAIAAIDPAFAPLPIDPLPFPSLLVASQTDPHASPLEAEEMAGRWGSHLLDAGDAGHINAESGHGPWPEGLIRFASFLSRL